MRLRTLSLSFVLLRLGFAACLAQQPTGPATLENLLHSDKARKPTAALKGDAADVGPKRFVGTVVRPQDGVKHPDLDKVWSVYHAVVARAAESIKPDIAKLFDAATAKGDLDAAEKWQATLGGQPTKQAATSARERLTATVPGRYQRPTTSKLVAELKRGRKQYDVDLRFKN